MSEHKRKKLTPPEVARLLGVAVGKVHFWIHTGELVAVDLATKQGCSPRFKIDVEDLAAFERSRRVVPPPPKPPRRRRAASIKQYV